MTLPLAALVTDCLTSMSMPGNAAKALKELFSPVTTSMDRVYKEQDVNVSGHPIGAVLY